MAPALPHTGFRFRAASHLNLCEPRASAFDSMLKLNESPRGRKHVDRLLVRWCQQSAAGEGTVAAPLALKVDPVLVAELEWVGRSLDRLLRRWADGVLAGDETLGSFRPPDFPLAKEFFAAGPRRAPFFWGRFDVFERADGGLAALEYNCDKPAGQREIWASEALGPRRGNPNRGARAHFRRALERAWTSHRHRFRIAARRPRLTILVDPAHREEFRLAYLFGGEAARLGWRWDVIDIDNLLVESGQPVAYGEPVDIVLRQYPTEHLHDLPAMPALWGAALGGRLLWLNDPRAIMAQSKSAFAHLHQLAAERRWLTRAEGALVRRYLPPTGLASNDAWLDRARARQEDWVIKPSLGRYSETVYIGALCSGPQWERALAEAATRPEDWVIQAYIPPRRRWLPHASGERAGHVNWGVYLGAGEPAGICPRIQPTPLTDESTTWWAPLVLGAEPPHRPSVLKSNRASMRQHGIGQCWQRIADRHALAGYTNVWSDGAANFTLAALGLSPSAWDELAHASLVLNRAIGRVLGHLHGHPELMAVLGIAGALAPLVAEVSDADHWGFLTRLDWALTTDGRWKLMEINSDTPAGLWECGSIALEVARLGRGEPLGDPFWPALTRRWRGVAERVLRKPADCRLTIGMVAARGAVEDHDQVRAHARAARAALPRASFEWGTPDEIVVRGRSAYLQDRRLDLLFRYYPMDWLAEPRFDALLNLLRIGHLPMLPPAHSLIPQSKAFLALLWQLLDQGFFPPAEDATIRAHVAFTCLDARQLGRTPYVVKPLLEREGLGVRFSSELRAQERPRMSAANVVFQEALELTTRRVPLGTPAGWRSAKSTLVFGVFLAGAEVAGLYTRAGARVTGREAVFVPTLRSPAR
jgi:glutathionylspermidine synthase